MFDFLTVSHDKRWKIKGFCRHTVTIDDCNSCEEKQQQQHETESQGKLKKK